MANYNYMFIIEALQTHTAIKIPLKGENLN